MSTRNHQPSITQHFGGHMLLGAACARAVGAVTLSRAGALGASPAAAARSRESKDEASRSARRLLSRLAVVLLIVALAVLPWCSRRRGFYPALANPGLALVRVAGMSNLLAAAASRLSAERQLTGASWLRVRGRKGGEQ